MGNETNYSTGLKIMVKTSARKFRRGFFISGDAVRCLRMSTRRYMMKTRRIILKTCRITIKFRWIIYDFS